jgi:hypothetical protein
LQDARRRYPFIEKIFADAGYQGPKMARTVVAAGCWKIKIVKRSDAAKSFVSRIRKRILRPAGASVRLGREIGCGGEA